MQKQKRSPKPNRVIATPLRHPIDRGDHFVGAVQIRRPSHGSIANLAALDPANLSMADVRAVLAAVTGLPEQVAGKIHPADAQTIMRLALPTFTA